MEFAIVDIETTGGGPKKEKITEIAIYIHDGLRVIDEFVSLVNPEKFIPPYITSLTGITNEMIADAPKFYEIAKKIVQITEGRIFVAHSAAFDYNFVKEEFKALGYEYIRKTLCTVRLSRRVFPGLKSYSLGRLCEQLGIRIENRHRAAGDALATSKLLEYLLAHDRNSQALRLVRPDISEMINAGMNKAMIENLPSKPGVYYFYNDSGDIIYIGKSINIKSRVLQHFYNASSQRAIEMKDRIASISYEKTGNELTALLLESHEIKDHKPLYNRAQRRSMFNYGLYASKNDRGYIELKIRKTHEEDMPLTTFTSQKQARDMLFRWIDEYSLCQKLCGLYNNTGACFHYGIGQCHGACIGEEKPEDYNARVQTLLGVFHFEEGDFLIIDQGRDQEEVSVTAVEHGKYCGFGFIHSELLSTGYDYLRDSVKTFQDNREVRLIIKNYLRKNGDHLTILKKSEVTGN